MNTIGKEKIIAGSLTVLLLAAVVTGSIFFKSNVSLKSNLSESKLRAESLLSEKLALDKEIVQFKDAMEALKGKNEQTDKILTETQKKLAEKERAYATVAKENAQVKNLKKQMAEVKEMKDNLMKQVDALNAQNNTLLAENKKLQSSVLALQEEKSGLLKQLEMAKTESLTKPDNFLVETYKNAKKDRLTFKSKRTKKIDVLFDMPQEYSSGISFNITTPDGKVITEKDKSLSWKFINDSDKNLTASINPFAGDLTVSTQVKLTYTPTEKMKPGEYKIGILKQGQKIGNCRVRLK